MAFSYIGNSTGATNGATELVVNVPASVALGQIMVTVVAFEGVAAGSGPWVIPNTGQYSSTYVGPFTSWKQLCYQSPSASGVGIEVWAAVYGSGTVQGYKFNASYAAEIVSAAWSGEYNPTHSIFDGAARAASTAQVTGNTPAAPSVYAFANEMIIACGGDLMASPGFGSPTGYTNVVDAERSGFGTVEASMAWATVASDGATGAITFPGNASSGATKGSTATLAIRAAASGPSATAPLIDVAYALT